MLIYIDGDYLLQTVAIIFAECWRYIKMPLFYIGSFHVSFWHISLSMIMFKVFRDMLDILGIWGYSSDEDELPDYEGRD